MVGRLERTFRQGAVGSFPPLDESWIFSTAGDPFCIVYPHPQSPGRSSARAGRPVRFTGTFLKTVRYAAGDGDRMAPLIVGDRPPAPGEEPTATSKDAGEILRAVGGAAGDHRAGRGTAGSWMLGLGLAIAAALVIAGQHVRGTLLRHRSARRSRLRDDEGPDPPLRFVDSPED